MPIGTPFHSRTEPLCASHNWRTWSGYLVASSYDVMHDYEYHAIRNTAGLIDISPLYKYDVTGEDALRLVNRVITRDAAKCAVGQALYGCICDNEGKVIQDGTVFRLGENHCRFNLAEPSVRWLSLNAKGMDIDIKEVSEQFAALALQGPNAYKILQRVLNVDIGRLRFFRLTQGKIQDVDVIVSRTGYTGDLGYEIWLGAASAPQTWDILLDAGKQFGIKPTGLMALDVARLEAGFILLEVDYIGTDRAMSPGQQYSPYEIGLGWTVDLNKEHFVGRKALLEEKAQGSPRQIVGLEIDLPAYESLFQEVGLPPQFPAAAWRSVVPLYRNGLQVGHATTGAWSPALKKYIALATVRQDCTRPGSKLTMEVLIEYTRKTAPVTVVPLPFYDPPRKRALFGK
ncbi:MAG: aminomethyl transferase family protein [Deltaproteobacteria bacterium]|nr:aminomethyl transferase family protein [Deltaproteobacteria bacterium]